MRRIKQKHNFYEYRKLFKNKKLAHICLFLMIGAIGVFSQTQTINSESNLEVSKATVYFLRAPEIPHSKFNPIVYYNNTELARIDSGRFFKVKLDAGNYIFRVDEQQLPLTLKSGENYYIQIEMKFSLFNGKGKPVFIDQKIGAAIIKQAKLKPLKPKMIINQTVVIADEKRQ